MTSDELTEMAQRYMDKSKPKSAYAFAKALEAVILMEREACAKLAEQTVCDTHLPTGVKIYGTRVAKAIRARSNP